MAERAGLHVDVKEDKQLDRVLEVVGSNEIMDRDGEVIKADGWDLENYRRNPIVLFAHNHREPPVAKAIRTWVHDGQLRFKLQFPTMEEYGFADTIFKLYRGGYMNAVSVGFMPKEWEWGKDKDSPRRTFTKQELLELSLVPIPSNPEALVYSRGMKLALAEKAIDEDELAEFKALLERMGDKAETVSVKDSGKSVEVMTCAICGQELTCPCCSGKHLSAATLTAQAGEPSYIEELLQDLGQPGREPTGDADEKSDEEESEETIIDHMLKVLKEEI